MGSQNRASRLLRIEVENVDDNRPMFAPNNQLSMRVFTINGDGPIESLRAIDYDGPPFDSIYYYLLESCSPDYTYAFYLNTSTGDLELIDANIEIPNNLRLCALARASKLDNNLSNIQFDRTNQSMIEFVVRKQVDEIDPHLRQNNTITIFDLQMPFEVDSRNSDNRVSFELESINFQPLKRHKYMPETLDLFSIESNTAEVRVDPSIVLQPQGIYTLKISAFDFNQTSNDKIGSLQSQVHFVREENKLKFVFAKPIEQIGLSIKSFINELDSVLTEMEQKQIKTILSAPCAFESNRSQACFYLVENGNQILSIEESINLTSTTIKPEKRLFKLYEQYRVINIENCLSPRKPYSALSSELMTRELFVWIVLVMGAFLILLSLVGYTCFVARYKEYIWQKTLQQSAKLTIPPYLTAFTGTTSRGETIITKA